MDVWKGVRHRVKHTSKNTIHRSTNIIDDQGKSLSHKLRTTQKRKKWTRKGFSNSAPLALARASQQAFKEVPPVSPAALPHGLLGDVVAPASLDPAGELGAELSVVFALVDSSLAEMLEDQRATWSPALATW